MKKISHWDWLQNWNSYRRTVQKKKKPPRSRLKVTTVRVDGRDA